MYLFFIIYNFDDVGICGSYGVGVYKSYIVVYIFGLGFREIEEGLGVVERVLYLVIILF